MFFELVVSFLIVWLLYKLYCRPFKYWESRNVPTVPAEFPWGTLPNVMFFAEYQGHVYQELYNKLKPFPYGGIYTGRTPELLLRSPEMIKNIMVKDATHFRCRSTLMSNKYELMTRHLFSLEDEDWRLVRVKLTPTFTSGKLKMMFILFEECAKNLAQHLESTKGSQVNVKDLTSRFTIDVIASCAFGIESNAIEDATNPFKKIGEKVLPPRISLKARVRSLLFPIFPQLKNINLGRIFPKESEDFFLDLVRETIKYRTENKIRRNDFIDLLLDVKNSGLGNDSDNLEMDTGLMAAQCFVFFVAGFETSSSVQSYALYELALHPQIQNKLREEIVETLKRHYGKVTYQALMEMEFLEQVINETIRKYPTLPHLTRVCSKDYTIPGTNIVIERGIKVGIPLYALHHDPEFHAEPEEFNPNRFSKENKRNMTPYTFLPFGEGPRNCIGMRFGMLQTKLGLVTMLTKYRVEPTPETPKELKFRATAVISTVDGPIYLKFEDIPQ